MNRPDLKSMKRSPGKHFFHRTAFALAALVLTSVSLTGCWKESVRAWKRTMNEVKVDNGGTRPDLVLAYQAEIHTNLYRRAVEEFNRKHNCNIALKRVKKELLFSALEDALEAGEDVPDMVELLEGTMGYFTDCPLEDVGLVDLTERLRAEGYLDPDKMVQSRYSLWSCQGHIFAIPHDVHPVALCYRIDLIEKLGIDVTKLKTWDDFVKEGQRITGEWDETDEAFGTWKGRRRYMIDFDDDSTISLGILLNQRGFDYFDSEGNVAFDRPEVAELIAWFVHQTCGPDRISFHTGYGQYFYQGMKEGLTLFYLTPDWRTMQYTLDLNLASNNDWNPSILKGKLALMPMPVWADKNGDRLPGSYATGTWGGTGLAITKTCRNQGLAWEFAKFLYLEAEPEDLMNRFKTTNIVSPVKKVWTIDGFRDVSPFFKQMLRDETGDPVVRPLSIGQFYASMADDTAPRHVSVHTPAAEMGVLDTYYAARNYYEKSLFQAGYHADSATLQRIDDEMLALIRKKLAEHADLIRNN